jgi:hypothetical protein
MSHINLNPGGGVIHGTTRQPGGLQIAISALRREATTQALYKKWTICAGKLSHCRWARSCNSPLLAPDLNDRDIHGGHCSKTAEQTRATDTNLYTSAFEFDFQVVHVDLGNFTARSVQMATVHTQHPPTMPQTLQRQRSRVSTHET